MPPLSLTQLYERYLQLGAQLQRREISHEQFVDQARQLQAQDASGAWWSIDPSTGSYLTYTGSGWVSATPSASQPAVQQARSPQAAPSAARQESAGPQRSQSGRLGCLGSSLLTGLLSLGSAGAWYAYTSLSPSSEGTDSMTPLVIAGTPLLLRLLQRPMDKLFAPLYKLLNVLPRPLLVGAALAVPVVMGGIFTRAGGSGYTGLQRSAFTSVVLGYILTRRPGASA